MFRLTGITKELVLQLNLTIDIQPFAENLAWEVVAGGFTIVDAIERLLGEYIEDSILQSLGDRIIEAPRSVVHPMYYKNRFENLASLRQRGYFTWYPEIRFATHKSDTLKVTKIEASGFDLSYKKFDNVIERKYMYMQKKLKSQVNHIIRLNKVTIPPCVFDQTIRAVKRRDTIKQPYIANLTVGCKNFVDDRIEGFRTVAFDHIITGERRLCHCHSETHASMLSDAKRMVSSFHASDSWPQRVINLLDHASYADGLCHFCISERHGEDAPFEWYGSQVQKHFEPYVDLLVRGTDMDVRTAKSEVKRRLSINRWVREAELYLLVVKLFPTKTIRREASPPWLGQQRLDIYLPELALAIEHQGEQHYRPIEIFGGEQAFTMTQERDKRKRTRCQENGVAIVEVRFDDPLTLPSLRSRLRRWLTK